MMEWLPAISTTTLLAGALWLSRNFILVRLTNSVKHEYEEKIEKLRAELRKSEEIFKSEISAKAVQIESLKTGALSGIVNKEALLYERRVKAVENVWGAVVSLAPAKSISAWMATLKFDAAAKEAARNDRFRQIFDVLGGGFDDKNLKVNEAVLSKPFITPLAWAYYSAYQAVVMHAVVKLKILQGGLEKDLTDVKAVTKLVKEALPNHEKYIEEYGANAFHYLLEELEVRILYELGNILQGLESDKESIQRAARILKEADKLMENNVSINDKNTLNK